MSALFEFTRRLRGLSNGLLVTNDGDGCVNGISGNNYGDGHGTVYGFGSGDGQSSEGRSSPKYPSHYSDGDIYGNGLGGGKGQGIESG